MVGNSCGRHWCRTFWSGKSRAVIGGQEIAPYNPGGEFFATEDFCAHGHVRLTEGYVEGDLVECPMHGGKFDIRTGKAAGAPCVLDLRRFPVKVEGEEVFVALPPEFEKTPRG
jgi:naphthalene 1,2-dioxygenase system ferredoxin subunit